jgi:hypothetical protein
MMRAISCRVVLAVAGLAIAAPVAKAQSDEAMAAALAVFLTPVGSFANVSPAALGESRSSAGFDYGRYSGDVKRNNYGVHLDWHALRATVGVSTASELENLWMAGLAAGRTLMSNGMVRVGGEANVGYGSLKEETTDSRLNAFSAGVRLPVSLSTTSDNLTVTPYLAPGGYFGRLSWLGESESGFRATLNGGVRFAFGNGVALDVGVQRIFIDDAETLFGAGLSFSRR